MFLNPFLLNYLFFLKKKGIKNQHCLTCTYDLGFTRGQLSILRVCPGAGGGGAARRPLWGETTAALNRTQLVPAGTNRRTAGHSWALQPWVGHPCRNIFKKGQNTTREWGKKCEELPCRHQGWRRRRCSRRQCGDSAAACGETTVEKVFSWSLQRGPKMEQGKNVGRKELQTVIVTSWVQPIPHLALCCSGWGQVEESGMKGWSWAWEEEGRWREGVLVFVFVSHHPALYLSGNRLNNFFPTWDCFAPGSNRWAISPSLSHPVNFSVLFCPLFYWGREVREHLGGHLVASQGQLATASKNKHT